MPPTQTSFFFHFRSFTPNGKEIDEEQSSMVVMEVSLPSGFAAEPDLVDTLMRTSNVKKVETRNGDSVVVLYFDYLKVNEPMCPLVEAYQAHIVAEQKPAPIVVYDYYDSCEYSIFIVAADVSGAEIILKLIRSETCARILHDSYEVGVRHL